jgi:hypothetical protein
MALTTATTLARQLHDRCNAAWDASRQAANAVDSGDMSPDTYWPILDEAIRTGKMLHSAMESIPCAALWR